MKRDVCCSGDCQQGRCCPHRERPAPERRNGPSLLWRLFGWLVVDQRGEWERRKEKR